MGWNGRALELRSIVARAAFGIKGRKTLAEDIVRRRRLGCLIFRIAVALHETSHVDVLFESESRVQYQFHALQAVFLDGERDLPRMGGGLFDDMISHLLLAVAEEHVVAREIGVPQDMCGHQHVLRQRVSCGKVGVAGVTRKHDLEEARMSHSMLNELTDVANAE